MKIKKSKMFIISMLILCFALSIMPMKVLANSEIGDVDIEGVTFNYNPGDAPKATAYKCDPWDEQYDIEYEYWEEMEKNAKGESVPVKYWYSDESKNNALSQDKKIITFEEGKTYMYSISLKAKDGNTFATNKKVMVNGKYVHPPPLLIFQLSAISLHVNYTKNSIFLSDSSTPHGVVRTSKPG
jgi:hypothetical protein